MALVSKAAMVLFYDIEGDTADHDDWHSYEHFHERLSVPGFLRATRWVAIKGAPRYMVTYEVSNVDVATSQGYLDRLNNPTEWTQVMMPRFRGMIRGFCRITASQGFGLGTNSFASRFLPKSGAEDQLAGWITNDFLPQMAGRRGMAGAHLLVPTAPPPMTHEQSLRGPDKAMPWLMMATAYDKEALQHAIDAQSIQDQFREHGARSQLEHGLYKLHHTATAAEVLVTPQPEILTEKEREKRGPGL